jgi:hypothetical protein
LLRPGLEVQTTATGPPIGGRRRATAEKGGASDTGALKVQEV